MNKKIWLTMLVIPMLFFGTSTVCFGYAVNIANSNELSVGSVVGQEFDDFHVQVTSLETITLNGAWPNPGWVADGATNMGGGRTVYSFDNPTTPSINLQLIFGGSDIEAEGIDAAYAFTVGNIIQYTIGNWQAAPVPEFPAGAAVPLGAVLLGSVFYLRRKAIKK